MGRIQVTVGSRFAPGDVFMGIELVKYLEDHVRVKRTVITNERK